MKVTDVKIKTWQDKKFVEITTMEKGVCTSWQAIGQTVKVGDDIEGTFTENPGRTPKITITSVNGAAQAAKPPFAGGAAKPANNKSFAAAYAKDMVVAMIAAGLVISTPDMDKLFEHYYKLFLSKME